MTTYRTDDRPKGEIRCYDAAELFDCKTIHEPAAQPDCPALPLGEWYCMGEDCVIREVRVACKLLEPGDRVPEMRCPGCGSKLKFHHWLKSTTLLKEPEA